MPDSVLALGGLLPASALAGATDLVDALAFIHPAIPARVVVRLVPEALTRGESSRFDLCGFVPAGATPAVARQRRRAVGFPEWALLHDPANARFALEVMKEFTVARKRIPSKPGHARDAFAATATALGRSAPQFLPSFWEEAGRAFAAAGNLPMAASAFEKARAAEREHALAVDESARAESFLEFALAGALTVKSLQAWAGELKKTEGPAVALERFTDLCVRRTLGGLPPWAGLAKDLRELARAAGEDPVTREVTFLRSVLTAPSLRRAPLAFWKDVAGARLAATPEGAAALASVLPSWHDDDQLGGWLDLLQGWGVVAVLAEHGLPLA